MTDRGHVDAGQLDRCAEVLECQAVEGGFAWVPVRRTWAAVERTQGRSLFSKAGLGAGSAVLTVRRLPLTLHNALRLGEEHFFLTSIAERGRGYLDLHTAVCHAVTLEARPQAGTGRDSLNRPVVESKETFEFPGVLTELYVRTDQEGAARTGTRELVVVTPKVVVLRAGDLVRRGEGPSYAVSRVLDLDPYKNEYVIWRQEDI